MVPRAHIQPRYTRLNSLSWRIGSISGGLRLSSDEQPRILFENRSYPVSRSGHGNLRGSVALELPAPFPLLVFLVCAVLFHFTNAAMLPLLGEMLAKGHGRPSMMFMSACVVTTQVVVTLLASWSGIKARQWGRKPLLLIAFGVLPVRGVLYALTGAARALIAIPILDGIGAAIFGVVSVIVIGDLTRGTGRFNLTLGAVTTA